MAESGDHAEILSTGLQMIEMGALSLGSMRMPIRVACIELGAMILRTVRSLPWMSVIL
jgi:hypothetical protein